MIEYRHTNGKGGDLLPGRWIKVSDDVNLKCLMFESYVVRVGTQIFNHNGPEFREAVEKERFWAKLRG